MAGECESVGSTDRVEDMTSTGDIPMRDITTTTDKQAASNLPDMEEPTKEQVRRWWQSTWAQAAFHVVTFTLG
jgi:hypothetical protein